MTMGHDDEKIVDKISTLETDVSSIKTLLSSMGETLNRLIAKGQTDWGTIAACVGVSMGVVIWVSELSREPLEEKIGKLEIDVQGLESELKADLIRHEDSDGHSVVRQAISANSANLKSHVEMDQQRHNHIESRLAVIELRLTERISNQFTRSNAEAMQESLMAEIRELRAAQFQNKDRTQDAAERLSYLEARQAASEDKKE